MDMDDNVVDIYTRYFKFQGNVPESEQQRIFGIIDPKSDTGTTIGMAYAELFKEMQSGAEPLSNYEGQNMIDRMTPMLEELQKNILNYQFKDLRRLAEALIHNQAKK